MKLVCNLQIVTNLVFMEDGTPKVSIPSHVLLEGIENQNQFIVGQFYRCKAPSGGLIHAVVTRLWGRKCRIHTRKIGESSYLFRIPDEPTRKWVSQRGIWHIDDCIMFVSPWSPSLIISLPEISTIPVWLTLKNIPYQLYSIKEIYWIASGIGEPMLTSKPWLDPTLMGEAKILVEVKLNKPFPQRVALEDTTGCITMVDILYSWLPTKCNTCGQLGHKASHCLGLQNLKTITSPVTVAPQINVGVRVAFENVASDVVGTDVVENIASENMEAIVVVGTDVVVLAADNVVAALAANAQISVVHDTISTEQQSSQMDFRPVPIEDIENTEVSLPSTFHTEVNKTCNSSKEVATTTEADYACPLPEIPTTTEILTWKHQLHGSCGISRFSQPKRCKRLSGK